MKYWDYYVNGEKGLGGWAKVLIAEDGRFHVVGDWGNYAYWWTSIGYQTMLEFVRDIADSPDYVCSKLNPRKELDATASFEAVMTHALEHRRAREWSKAKAYNFRAHVEYHSSNNDWEGFLRDARTSEYFGEPWDFAQLRYSSDVWNFATKVMPKLAELVKKDIPGAIRRQTRLNKGKALSLVDV